MKIRLTKNTGKSHFIKYVRDNGSETWMPADDFSVRHDISHYALEKVLGYKTAFNGMINSGIELKDFEDREKRLAMNVSNEAVYAENMANLFLGEVVQGNFEDFNAVQQQTLSYTNTKIPELHLTLDQVQAVRSYFRELLDEWESLPAGQTMELEFTI